MLKFLIISFLVLYVLSKIGSFFFRAGVASEQHRTHRSQRPEGTISVDSTPKKQKRDGKKGGEYIDYEEVK